MTLKGCSEILFFSFLLAWGTSKSLKNNNIKNYSFKLQASQDGHTVHLVAGKVNLFDN